MDRRSSFGAQVNALARRTVTQQEVINKQLDSRSFRCGCECLSCCDWVPSKATSGELEYACFDAVEGGPSCSPYAECSRHNDSNCGYLFSTSDQVSYCSVPHPPRWPAVVSTPLPAARLAKAGSVDPAGISDGSWAQPPTAVGADGWAASPGDPPAPMLYTGADRAEADRLMAALWQSSAGLAAAAATGALALSPAPGSEAGLVAGMRGLSATLQSLGLALGSPAPTSLSLLVEPAFVAGYRPGASNSRSVVGGGGSTGTSAGSQDSGADAAPRNASVLYFLRPDCRALSDADRALLAALAPAVANVTGMPSACASVPPRWVPGAAALSDLLYCASATSHCLVRDGARVEFDERSGATSRADGAVQRRLLQADASAPGGEMEELPRRQTMPWVDYDRSPSAASARQGAALAAQAEAPPTAALPYQQYVSALFDWGSTSPERGLSVSVWVNDSATAQQNLAPRDVQRWNAPVNLAADAFARRVLGPEAGVPLAGTRDMPRGVTRLRIDFSSLLGPLFLMWFLQLQLPVNVHALTAEKERGLRAMMRMQGARAAPMTLVSYAWMLAQYAASVGVLVGAGAGVGLRIITRNSAGVQAVLYALWGLVLASWSLWCSALARRARPAALAAVVVVIVSGFVANVVMVQYLELGPRAVATVLQFWPSFALYRGLYELSQYAFLADRTGAQGLTWAKLRDPQCGMLSIWAIMAGQALVLPLVAAYVDHVSGAGTGLKKHWLFFLPERCFFWKRKQRPALGTPVRKTSRGSDQREAEGEPEQHYRNALYELDPAGGSSPERAREGRKGASPSPGQPRGSKRRPSRPPLPALTPLNPPPPLSPGGTPWTAQQAMDYYYGQALAAAPSPALPPGASEAAGPRQWDRTAAGASLELDAASRGASPACSLEELNFVASEVASRRSSTPHLALSPGAPSAAAVEALARAERTRRMLAEVIFPGSTDEANLSPALVEAGQQRKPSPATPPGQGGAPKDGGSPRGTSSAGLNATSLRAAAGAVASAVLRRGSGRSPVSRRTTGVAVALEADGEASSVVGVAAQEREDVAGERAAAQAAWSAWSEARWAGGAEKGAGAKAGLVARAMGCLRRLMGLDEPLVERSPLPDLERSSIFPKSPGSAPPPLPPAPPALVMHGLRKVYPGGKVAVSDLSLCIPRGECFGLLGPNGAGKTTTLRLLQGLVAPSQGRALVAGCDLLEDAAQAHARCGVCPQHDVLWPTLTAREHLLFYGRLRNLRGEALAAAVRQALVAVNLLAVADNPAATYSGGMQRRLSVAIALLGDPQVVYLDEPTTGLDPASRRLLWTAIRRARESRAIILTTHSMEEAEALCDRLGIFVAGRLQCVGEPRNLTARYGGFLALSVTTPQHQEGAAHALVRALAPSARLVYAVGGTQKFELPLHETSADVVFSAMERAKAAGEMDILDWGVSHATLEEVFVKLCNASGVTLSAFT